MEKRENITVSIPPEWLEKLEEKAKNKSWLRTHYVRELIRADLNMPLSIRDHLRAPRRETSKTPSISTTSKRMQILLPRRAQDIIMGMVSQTGWSISSVVQRILETDLAPILSRAVIRKSNQSQLMREFSTSGKALGAEFWKQYYLENPKSPVFNLAFYMPLDWPDVLQAKADMSATTVYLLVREVLMKRLFGKEYLTADTDAA